MPSNFRPNLIVSIWACTGIIFGSVGPWMTNHTSSRTGFDECGSITLALGICASIALLTHLFRGITPEVKNHWVGPLAGVAVLIVAGANAATILQRGIEIAGMSVDPSIGWGLWLVTASAIVLCISSSTVAQLIRAQAQS